MALVAADAFGDDDAPDLDAEPDGFLFFPPVELLKAGLLSRLFWFGLLLLIV